MAGTNIRLTKSSKSILDRLQACLTSLGYRLTKSQVLELSLVVAAEAPENLIARLKSARYPVPGWEEVLREVVASAEDWGPTSWRDIDPLVYGGHPKR